MRKMALRSFAHPDKAHAVIELSAEGERLGSISLDVATLEKLIRNLAKIRDSLNEGMPSQLRPDAQLEVTHRAPVFLASSGGGKVACCPFATLATVGLPSRFP